VKFVRGVGTMVKIRLGFVSNSSSGSFILKSGINKKKFLEKIEKINAFAKDMGYIKTDDEKLDQWDLFEIDDLWIRKMADYFYSELRDVGVQGLEFKYCGRLCLDVSYNLNPSLFALIERDPDVDLYMHKGQ
jgi:hypothetical protein